MNGTAGRCHGGNQGTTSNDHADRITTRKGYSREKRD